MAYGYATTHSSSANLTVYIIRRFLNILRNKLRMARYATMADIPVRSGSKVARWILPVDIGTHTTAISEFGSANEVATLTWSTYESTVSTYGAFSKISDMADASWLPQARNKVSDVFAYGASKTIDTLLRNDADNSTTVLISGQANTGVGTALTTSDTATTSDVVAVAGALDEADAEGFEDVGGDYVLVVHGRTAKQMQAHVEPGGATTGVQIEWHKVMSHTVPGQRKLQRYEMGTYAMTSIQKSNNIAQVTLTSTVTAYANIGLSKDAYGRCNLDMRNSRVITIPPNTKDKSDPLGLYGTIGWKARFAHRALDVNNRAVKYYTAI